MIVSYPNYLDQTQAIGINGVIQWHGEHTAVETPFPLYISIDKKTEYGITISRSVEYGIATSHGGCT